MMKALLANTSTRAPQNFKKEETKAKLPDMFEELNQLQTLLYAGQTHSLLIILQGLDASGKDGAINNVFTSVNPQGIFVKSFKQPTQEELAHDFLWRVHHHTPAKGMIHVFNRSHYEDVIVTRVHKWIDDDVATKRMKTINDFERLLTDHNQTLILKFYLHVSQEEQQQRLQERITDPTKQWKFSENDVKEAKLWDDYMKAYEDCFAHCNKVPWIIVPADQNWYKEYVIASSVIDTLAKLKMQYPKRKSEK